jgi:3-hydroxyisobutyrate dehydrogenase-like beta-hydroxyacid dehydrogenase
MADQSDIRIGLIGLGNAGQAILQPLSASVSVHVFDRNTERYRDLPAICQQAPIIETSAAELAKACDLIIFSLPTPAASLSVAEEICTALKPQAIILETSTVRPEDVEAVHTIIAATGARVVDAAVVGGVHKLAQGKGVFLAGVPEEDAGIVGVVLRKMAEEILFLGARGDGMRTKLIVNGVAHAAYVVLLEAGALAAKQNIPLTVLYKLLARESGLMRPLTHRFGERLRAGNFDGGMSTNNAHKDSGLILDVAHKLGVPLFATEAAHGVYEKAIAEGLGTLDYASVGKLWEKWLGVSFAEDAKT